MADPTTLFIATDLAQKQMIKNLEIKRMVVEAQQESMEQGLAGRMASRVRILFQERVAVRGKGQEAAEPCAA